jgi:hypothetical protein
VGKLMKVWIITLTDVSRGDVIIEAEPVFASTDFTTASRKFLEYKETYSEFIDNPDFVYEEGSYWFTIHQEGNYNNEHAYVALFAVDVQ